MITKEKIEELKWIIRNTQPTQKVLDGREKFQERSKLIIIKGKIYDYRMELIKST